jgi:diacylglycerol kinase family enzyme
VNATARRLCAIAALACGAAAIAVAVVVLWNNWLVLLGSLALVVVALAAAWYVVTRRGAARVVATVVVVAAAVTAFATLLGNHSVGGIVVVVLLVLAFTALARAALRSDPATLRDEAARGEPGAPARRPVLILNPRSGGGKADARFAEEARARGIETVVLEPGDDLEQLARDAVDRGADVLGMAGGDGSQALVAGVASEHGLAFVCIPAGTRNHFALDLGIDRDDVVGALDAFTDGHERRVDLARVNGRVFVNNVSFGVYAAIVQSDEYRDAKLGTVAKMLPELLGPDFDPFDFELDGPDAIQECDPDLILVSNNVYKLEGVGGLGTRARLDEGVLGVIVIEVHNGAELARLVSLSGAGRGSAYAGWHEWTAPVLEVRSGGPVYTGIDGEAVTLDPPVRLVIEPGALRVRIAPHHPGVSPAHVAAAVQHGALGHLLRVAFGPPARGGAGAVPRG